MQYPVLTPATVLSLFLWSLSKVAVRLLSNFGQMFHVVLPLSEATHLLLTRSTIPLSIISLQVLKGIPKVENSSKSAMVMPPLAKSSAMQLPGIFLCPGTFVIHTKYQFAISLRHLRQSYTVLKLITLDCNALMAA